uniref:ATP-dependent RNA helicase n=1 Tax=Panagrolaimus superbus TaxID=310955 RepID=A0A914ZGD1_9BILA
MSVLPNFGGEYDQFGKKNVQREIFRDYRIIRKPQTRTTKAHIPTDVGIREKDLAVQQDDEFFEFDDDISCITTAPGNNKITKAPEYFHNYDDLDKTLRNNLNALKYEQITPVQRIIVPLITGKDGRHRDVICCARTGSGKTLGYLVGAINNVIFANRTFSNREYVVQHNVSVLIMLQNNNAAGQIYNLAKHLASKTSVIIGTAIGIINRSEEIEAFNHYGADILIATIGRLTDYLTTNPNLLKGVNLLVFDDAEAFMRDEDWQKAISLIRHKNTIEGPCQTVCLSAGFDKRSFEQFTSFVEPGFWFIDIASLNKVEKRIPQIFMDTANKDRTDEIMKLLMARSKNNRYPKTIIFCNSKEVATMLSHRLRLDHKIPETFRPYAAYYHGGTYEPQSVFNAFCAERGIGEDILGDDSIEIDVLVACDGMAYGINTKVELVINFDFPASLCIYAQRIGRLCRQGVKGESFTLLDSQSIRKNPARIENNIRNVLHAANEANARIPDSLELFVEGS